ncbi:PD-(D/E)XK nuclease family protein [Thermodesulfobacteriota bacterium]
MTEIRYFTGKTVFARHNLLKDRISVSKGESFLHIVPTKGGIMELETDPEFWLERKLNTLTGVIHQIFSEEIQPGKYHNYSPVDNFLQSILIKKVLKNRDPSVDGLLHFNLISESIDTKTDYPGIYRNISRFFSLLYRNNYEDIYANDLGGKILRQEAENPGSAEVRYALESDLLWLMGEYEELKREIKVYDENEIFTETRNFLQEKNIPSLISDISVIILDGITHLSRIEEDILFYLISNVDELWWLVDFETDEKDPVSAFRDACGRESEWEENQRATEGNVESLRALYPLGTLMKRLGYDGNTLHVEQAQNHPYPNAFAGALYASDNVEEKDAGTLKIRSFAGEVEEIKGIASEIKRIIHEDNLDVSRDLGKIRIIFPDLDDYSSILNEIFREYGLPYSLTKGIPLSSHPLSLIFLKTLQLAIDGFKRQDLFSLFSSDIIEPGYFPFEIPDFEKIMIPEKNILPGDIREDIDNILSQYLSEPVHSRFDIYVFDKGAIRCGIEKLGDNIENIGHENLSFFSEIYTKKIKDTKNSEEKESLRLEYYLFIYQCEILRNTLDPFKKFLKYDSPEQIADTFKKLLCHLGFPVNILDIHSRGPGIRQNEKRRILKRDIRAFTLLNELIDSAKRETDLSARLFNIKKSKEVLIAFYEVFKKRVDNKYLLDERNPDVIRVSQWLETRGRSFDYLFAGGLTANRFPLREEADFIIPDTSRRKFRIIDPIDQSKYLFSSLLKNYRKRLYLSYPEYISEKPVQPSQVLQDLYALCSDNNSEKSCTEQYDIKWETSPYLASRDELINSGITKNEDPAGENAAPFKLKNVIIKHDSFMEDITRGIKALMCRWAVNGLFEYDGFVSKAFGYHDFIEGRSNIFSSSSLDTLANCPMRYLFKYIYNIKALDDITPDTTPGDLGNYIHNILSLLFKKFKHRKSNISRTGIAEAFSLAKKTVDKYVKENPLGEKLDLADFYTSEMFSGLDRDHRAMSEDKNIRWGIFALLLFFEEEEFKTRIPAGIEFEFGTGKSSVNLGKTPVRGYIDRFDIDMNNPGNVFIYDYKTGYIKASSNVKKGLSFQLPVYIKAVKKLLDPDVISAAFYSLKKNAFTEKAPLKNIVNYNFDSRHVDINGVTLIDTFADQLLELVEEGRFHHSADYLECTYCSYRYACQRDERRMSYLLESKTGKGIYSGDKNLQSWKVVDDFRKEWKKTRQSMDKAHTLKTETARQGHFNTVLEFRDKLHEKSNDLPFTNEYITGLIKEIDRFESGYRE